MRMWGLLLPGREFSSLCFLIVLKFTRFNLTLSSCEIKLVSVPEMRYFGKENKGEIWCRGHNVFKGYLKDAAKTAEALTPDGWLKTGDIGSIDSKGRLSIIDRKKNIFKLSQGEYVAPEKLENTFVKSGFVAQIYVHGDSLQV